MAPYVGLCNDSRVEETVGNRFDGQNRFRAIANVRFLSSDTWAILFRPVFSLCEY